MQIARNVGQLRRGRTARQGGGNQVSEHPVALQQVGAGDPVHIVQRDGFEALAAHKNSPPVAQHLHCDGTAGHCCGAGKRQFGRLDEPGFGAVKFVLTDGLCAQSFHRIQQQFLALGGIVGGAKYRAKRNRAGLALRPGHSKGGLCQPRGHQGLVQAA